MPIISEMALRDPHDDDARFIGLAAALRCFKLHHVFDNEKIHELVCELAGNDTALVARSMYFAQWISK